MKCDLCGDVGRLDLRGRCHPTAPLRAEIEDGTLRLFCYVPECNRLVAYFQVMQQTEITWVKELPDAS